jgi:hypothetical protein
MGERWSLGAADWRARAATALCAVGVACALSPSLASASLPDGRGYEMVSPADKNGGDASSALVAATNGDRLAFNSGTSFAGAPAASSLNSYVAQRTPSGWTTRSMEPATGTSNLALAGAYTFADFSSDLSHSILWSRAGSAEPSAQNIFTTSIDGGSRWVTAPTVSVSSVGDKYYSGRSADGSHIVFESNQPFTGETDGSTTQVWEWVDGRVRLVSVLPDGTAATFAVVTGNGYNGAGSIGTNFGGTLPEPTAVSDDGRRIVWGNSNNRLFVREDGARTTEISLSQKTPNVGQVPVNPARFAGAAADGSIVYINNVDQLTDDATTGGGLYAYDLASGNLRFVSRGFVDPAGVGLESVPLVTQDGKRAYFIATGQLAPGEGVSGGHNLYVTDGRDVSLVATLSSPLSHPPEATPDGGRLVFSTTDQLTSFDNAGHVEVYLYDLAAGSLTCVSCGPAGHVATGDAALGGEILPAGAVLDVSARTHGISDDGSRVFFQTTDGLVPQDSNGVQDVYQWHNGTVSLISAGTGKYESVFWAGTPSGSDVFFSTRDSLVGWDVDGGATDLYDARVNGGFPEPVTPVPCDGDGCQPQQTVAPASGTPATVRPGAKSTSEARAPRVFVRPITTTGRKNALKTGTLTLVVAVEGAGTVTASGKASYGDHRVLSIKSVKWAAKKAGTKNLKVRVPAAALKQARAHHKVTLSITVTHNKATSPAHVALTLR